MPMGKGLRRGARTKLLISGSQVRALVRPPNYWHEIKYLEG